jgi:ATP-dependent DNA helicase PIF1
MSRVKSKKGLKILIHDKENGPLKTTTNVVFKEVFQNLSNRYCLNPLIDMLKFSG